MPIRPKQHELEDLSRIKFQSVLPRRWVFRDKNKDYGIDGEIELFDENQNAQGLIFYVQLKATESKKEATIMSVDFDITTLLYYKKLAIPVLLVRYSEYKDLIYIKWVSNIDLFFKKDKAKTFRIKLTEDNRWEDYSADRIENRLINIRKIRSGYFNFPLPYTININEAKIRDITKSILITGIRKKIKDYSYFLEFSKEELIVDIQLDKRELKVSIYDLSSCSFHSICLMDKELFVENISKDILLALACNMIQLGQIEYCAQIIFTSNLQDRLLEKKEVLVYLLPPLFQTSYFDRTLELIGEIIDNNSYHEISIITMINVLIGYKSNNKARENAIGLFFKKRLNKAIDEKDDRQIGISYYNLANYYRGQSLYSESIEYYIKAKKLAPIYLQQHYYYSEVAGILFLLEKFRFSSKLYNISLELGATGLTRGLYADALMFSGEYEKSNNEFLEYIKLSDSPSEEFQLKSLCLNKFIKDIGIRVQQRRQEEALLNADIIKTIPGLNVMEQLETALQLDLLCGLAWFNLGILQVEQKNHNEAIYSFIMAGLVQKNDITAWLNATLCFFNRKMINLAILPLVIKVAYNFNGDDFLIALYSHIEEYTPFKDSTVIRELIEPILANDDDDEDRNPIVRVLNDNGKFVNIFDKSSL